MGASERAGDAGRLVLRVAVGGLMLFHGIFKMRNGVGWMTPMLADVGLPPHVAWGAYLGEVAGPLLVLAGWQARIGAALIAFDMVAAILLALRSQIFALKPSGGGWAIELELLFLLGAVAIFLLGAGRYAVGSRAVASSRKPR
jgi:putative oxidoreductase